MAITVQSLWKKHNNQNHPVIFTASFRSRFTISGAASLPPLWCEVSHGFSDHPYESMATKKVLIYINININIYIYINKYKYEYIYIYMYMYTPPDDSKLYPNTHPKNKKVWLDREGANWAKPFLSFNSKLQNHVVDVQPSWNQSKKTSPISVNLGNISI